AFRDRRCRERGLARFHGEGWADLPPALCVSGHRSGVRRRHAAHRRQGPGLLGRSRAHAARRGQPPLGRPRSLFPGPGWAPARTDHQTLWLGERTMTDTRELSVTRYIDAPPAKVWDAM